MNPELRAYSKWSGRLLLAWLASGAFDFLEFPCLAQPAPAPKAVVVQKDGLVEVSRAGAVVWDAAYTNQLLYPEDQLRTGEGARAALRLSDQTLVRVGELSRVQIPADPRKRSSLGLLQGLLYFFHRDDPGDHEIRTRTVSAIVRGTEFSVQVAAADGTTILSLFDGAVEMTNEFGALALRSGQQGVAEPGRPPRLTPLLTVQEPKLIQWCLYYPGILHLPDLNWTAEETNALAASLQAYAAGDLLAAYATWPPTLTNGSATVKLYQASISLAVGRVEAAERLLDEIEAMGSAGRGADTSGRARPGSNQVRLAAATRRMIGVVRGPGARDTAGVVAGTTPGSEPALATEWLVESYARQKRMELEEAWTAARSSVEVAPDFAFGWVRVAELEFAFGRTTSALDALEKALRLGPRNAQAHALRGFLLAAQNRVPEAIASFDQALAIDGNLDQAWLGRGLCQIRLGQKAAGRQDLQTAVTLNPDRAVLRSYLAKAYQNEGDEERAQRELLRAMSLDPNDPTAWLYAALLKQQQNRVNDAIRDLERAQELNRSQTRGVVRSRLLLDQDRAVAGANLASMYLDAGMVDVSVREAVTAVNSDYTSYRSHLFLANSYNALRDPYQINLRYESPWQSEYLVSTLLAPVGAGVLSPYVSQQEYSRLFEHDHVGLASSTEYRSNGDWQQTGAQYGIIGNTSYAIDGTYRNLNGFRSNQETEQLTLNARLQEQLGPMDSLFIQATYYYATAGDVAQYYDPSQRHPHLQTKETQEPLLLAGYHHQWSEQSHTLALAGHFQDTYRVTDPDQAVLLLLKDAGGSVVGVPVTGLPIAPLDYKNQFDGYTTELQQLWKGGDHTLAVGGRVQGGTFQTRNALGMSTFTLFGNTTSTSAVPAASLALTNSIDEDFFRGSAYAYDNWQIFESVLVSAGLAFDHLEYPSNFRRVPISGGQSEVDRLSPKAGLTWSPFDDTTVRGAYTRSLGGVAFDQSFSLEPTQVAGFNQAYRNLIPESVVGSIAGAKLETFGLALDQKISTGTYFGVMAEQRSAEAAQDLGTVDVGAFLPFPQTPGSTREQLDYRERNLVVSLNQLVGHDWSFGARYRLSDARLETDLVAIPDSVSPAARSTVAATLQSVDLYALFRHQSGFFAQADSIWVTQSNRHYTPDIPGDDFWQFNVMVGWSFWQRRLEVRTGVLNLTGRDYRLNPLNVTAEYPRERTWVAGLKFYF